MFEIAGGIVIAVVALFLFVIFFRWLIVVLVIGSGVALLAVLSSFQFGRMVLMAAAILCGFLLCFLALDTFVDRRRALKRAKSEWWFIGK